MRTHHRDAVDWLTFDRPERLNAFTGPDYRDLRLAVERAVVDPATRAIVLTGEGRAFSAGADRSLVDGTADAADLKLAGEEFDALLDTLGRCELPILAAVNGLACGFGGTLLLHCASYIHRPLGKECALRAWVLQHIADKRER